jgi:hypothetical protein
MKIAFDVVTFAVVLVGIAFGLRALTLLVRELLREHRLR